ncbi:hypothetical protein N431DRAFT_557500 [Stipitochalara longipes BDJ]|nr:hypothetical protein N431DRAFT_557500 [Stipitochalara longipes BDJ]
MYVTITRYGCGHNIEEYKDCRWYREEAISAGKERAQRGFLMNFFRRSKSVVCPLPPGRQDLAHEICPNCTEDDKQKEENLRELEKFMSQDEFERTRLEVKWRWTCNACHLEERTVESYQRKANGGACCARGHDEFEAWEKRQRYRSVSSRYPSRVPHADDPRELGPDRQGYFHFPSPGIDPGLEFAKMDANKAARDNGWDPDYDGLEPHLVAEFVNLSGMGPGSLPPPPPPPKSPQPYYEDAGIDLDRWTGARRTGHGSYPAPNPPPEDPLPVRPLRCTTKTARVSATTTARVVAATKETSAATVRMSASVARPGPQDFYSRPEAPLVRSAPRRPRQSTPPSTVRYASSSQASSAPKRSIRGSPTVATQSIPSRRPVATPSPLQNPSTRPVASSGPSRSSRHPTVATASSTRSNPFSRPAATSDPSRSSSRQPAAALGPSTPSRKPASKSGPPSTLKPLPTVYITSRHKHVALQAGRRVTTGSSRGSIVPKLTVDENGVSPPSSPVSEGSSVSPMNSHALRGKKSVFHELRREIDDTMDCFQTRRRV